MAYQFIAQNHNMKSRSKGPAPKYMFFISDTQYCKQTEFNAVLENS